MLVEALDSEEWYPRNAAATALVQLGDAGLAAVCGALPALEAESIRHYWGLLDAAGGTEAAIVRAARGERRLRRLVGAAAARGRDRAARGAGRPGRRDGPLRDAAAGAQRRRPPGRR